MKCFLPLAAGLCIAMLACNDAANHNYNAEAKDSIAPDNAAVYNDGSSSAAVQNNADTVHRFIRTADLKFKVADVTGTTYKIEDIVSSHGGFVTLTQLNSDKENETTTPVSEDSAMETTRYTVVNTMTVRVPNTQLDTTLKDIARLVGYLDYRIIKADDVSLQLRSNNLQQKRSARYAGRLTNDIATQGKKLSEITTAEDGVTTGETDADNALLSNLSLNDQVSYSTVQLSIYQHAATLQHLVATDKEIVAYKPGFGNKIFTALYSGVELLESIFIGLLYIWPLLLLAVAGIWIYRKYYHPRISK